MSIYKLNDFKLRLFGIPLFGLLAAIVFYSDEWLLRNQPFGKIFFTSLLNSVIIWHVNRYIVIVLRKRFPSIRQTYSRVWRQLLLSTIASVIIAVLISYMNDKYHYWGRIFDWRDYVYNVIVVLFFVYVAITIYELNYYFEEWQSSITETEKLKKANLQSQFDSLKNQVSPHFLFNSLNTLSSLIEEEPDKAVVFVNELSRVYRYLLQSNEKEMSTLEEELGFLQAYFFLLKTRFEEGISMDITIADKYKSSLIPPLTLQILVENAVKHNIISISKPLKIEVQSQNENELVIKNNLQKKTLNVASTGMGLANISAKFRLLNKPEIQIEETENSFIVTLPLINN